MIIQTETGNQREEWVRGSGREKRTLIGRFSSLFAYGYTCFLQ